MDREIVFENTKIKFHDLLTTGHNMDKFILDGSLFQREDHDYSTWFRLLHEGNVVYDIGAYIGTFCIPFAIKGMEVYAFEGFPDNFERLEKNVKPYDNITPHLMAVSNKNETITAQFDNCMNQPNPPYREINYRIFDEYVKEHKIPEPQLVKIDIEGMETLALFGMTNLLENVRPIFQIGYHIGQDAGLHGYPSFVPVEEGGFDFDMFDKLDYYVGPRPFSEWGEYYCIPKEKM